MWDVSARFLDALRSPHTVVSTADVFYAGALVRADLPISGGSVTVDEGSQVRRTLSLEVADPALNPADVVDLLAPFGTELLIRRGIEFSEGDREMVPLGVFGVQSVSQGRWDGTVSVTGADRSKMVADSRLILPRNVFDRDRVVDLIVALIREVSASTEFYSVLSDPNLFNARAKQTVIERDRWKAIEELATSIGCEIVFDPLGRAVLRVVPSSTSDVYGRPLSDLNTGPIAQRPWRVDSGPRGVLLDVASGVSREGVYNFVRVEGEQPDLRIPVYGVAAVTDGPLRWGGPFGQVPRFFTSKFITETGQAQAAAQGILVRSAGFNRVLSPTSIVNPALDVGDFIEVVTPDGRNSLQVVRQLEIPLDVEGAMKIKTRVLDLSVGTSAEGTFS